MSGGEVVLLTLLDRGGFVVDCDVIGENSMETHKLAVKRARKLKGDIRTLSVGKEIAADLSMRLYAAGLATHRMTFDDLVTLAAASTPK
jgi:hypothetical protein